MRDIETIEMELLIRDIASVDKRLEKLQKNARMGDKDAKKELLVIDIVFLKMNEGILVHDIELTSDQSLLITPLSLLTDKPTLYVANVDENEIISEKRSAGLKKVFDFAEERGNAAIRLCGKLEAEISNLEDEEREFFLEEYNLHEPGLDKLIHASYDLLGLETFFTAGEKEVRAWTISKGISAPRAAGEIHSDIERGFIKAEIYSFAELMQYKSEAALKEAGKIRQEGKNYLVQDGDLIFFKFNV